MNGTPLGEEKISSRQAIFLLVILIFPTGLFFLPSVASHLAGQDAWLSMLLATLAGLLIAWITANLSLRFPDKTLFKFLELILGRWPGKLVALSYVWWYIHTTAEVLRQFGDFMSTIFLAETPIIVIEILIMAIAAYTVRGGLEVFARVNDLILPLILAAVLVMFVLGTPEMDFKRLLPVFVDNGIVPVMKGSVMPATWMGYVVTICVLTPCLNKPQDAYKVAAVSTITFGLYLSIVAVSSIATFGPEVSARWIIPFLNQIRMIHIANFLDRLEPALMVIWVAGGAVQLSFFYWVAVLGCAQWLGLKDYKPLVLPVGVILLALSIMAHDSILDLFTLVSLYWGPYALTLYQAGIPLLLLAVAVIRGHRGARQ